MKTVLIVGAGGFGRELFSWCTHDPAYGKDWIVEGFLDDNATALRAFDLPVEVIGAISDYRPSGSEELVCAVGLPKIKRKVVETLKSRGARFRQLIHPTVVLGRNVRLGEGVVLCPGVILTCNNEFGDFVTFNCNASAGHDVRVGRFCTINAHCDLTGFVAIGEEVLLGSGARVIPGRRVGDRAVVGAGSVVIMNVGADTTVFGNPARRLG